MLDRHRSDSSYAAPLRWRPIFASLVMVAANSLGAGRALGQTVEAEALIRKGLDLRHQGHDAQAVPYLENAYKLSRTPRTAAQLGLVSMALGYWVDAERYLDEALGDPDNPWVATNRHTLEAARGRVRGFVGDLTITGDPDGAEVLVNGKLIGHLPLAKPVHIGKGVVEVALRAPGYSQASKTVTVEGAGKNSLSMVLVRDPTATIPTGAGSGASTPIKVAEHETPQAGVRPMVVRVPEAREGPTPTRRSALRPFAWGTAVGSLGGLTLGIVETFAARDKLNSFNTHTSASPTDPTMRVLDCTTNQLTPDCKTIRDTYSAAKTIAVVGYVVGGALAVTSVVLFVVSSATQNDNSGRSTTVSSFGCAPMLATAGATCDFGF